MPDLIAVAAHAPARPGRRSGAAVRRAVLECGGGGISHFAHIVIQCPSAAAAAATAAAMQISSPRVRARAQPLPLDSIGFMPIAHVLWTHPSPCEGVHSSTVMFIKASAISNLWKCLGLREQCGQCLDGQVSSLYSMSFMMYSVPNSIQIQM